jgi:hypothetical protein
LDKGVNVGSEFVDGKRKGVRGSEAQWQVVSADLDIEGSASLRGFLRAQVKTELYEFVGPKIGLEPFIDLDIESRPDEDRAICKIACVFYLSGR